MKAVVVPMSLGAGTLFLTHSPELLVNTSERGLLEMVRGKCCWHYTARGTYTTASDCKSCAIQGAATHYLKAIRLFTAAGQFEFLPMDILGSLAKTKWDKQYGAVFEDHNRKLGGSKWSL